MTILPALPFTADIVVHPPTPPPRPVDASAHPGGHVNAALAFWTLAAAAMIALWCLRRERRMPAVGPRHN